LLRLLGACWLIVGICNLLACAPEAGSGPRPSPMVYRGTVVLGHEVRTFTACGEEQAWWLVPTPELVDAYTSLGANDGAPIYAEVRGYLGAAPESGFGAELGPQLEVSDFLRAAPDREGPSCDEDLEGIIFRAAGNEPFWSLEVRGTNLVLTRLGAALIEALGPVFEAGADVWAVSSPDDPSAPNHLTASFHRRPCTGTMLGVHYSWTASVEVAGQRLSGCAWTGADFIEPNAVKRGQTPP
jgi:putative lipoprotein